MVYLFVTINPRYFITYKEKKRKKRKEKTHAMKRQEETGYYFSCSNYEREKRKEEKNNATFCYRKRKDEMITGFADDNGEENFGWF